MGQERLDKIVAGGMKLSRSDARKLIARGTVCVEGKTQKDIGCKVDSQLQRITVSGREIAFQKHLYILVNKPLGIISSTGGRDGRTVLELLPEPLRRRGLFPAGRLDKYSEGMMIITDDGDFAHRMLSPVSHVPKLYYVETDAPVMTATLQELFTKGVFLGDGEYSSPAKLDIVTPTSGYVTIHEGIYHQVRRMFDKNGGKVTRLVRVRIGGLTMEEALVPGASRLLTEKELNQIFE